MGVSKHVLMVLGSYDQSAHEGIARYAGEQGWHLNVSILKDFQLPDAWKGDGIITSLNNSRALEDFICKTQVPVVDLSLWRMDLPLPRVVVDNAQIGRLAAQHFLDLGYQHFAWFALAKNPATLLRFRAYEAFLHEHTQKSCIRLDTYSARDAEYLSKNILELPKPCAIFAKSDYDAAWLVNVCKDCGLRVPDDIAILGADDNPLICEYAPIKLSSVRYDLKKIGYLGANMLNQLMAGDAVCPELVLVPPAGVTVRASTDLMAVSDPVIRDLLQHVHAHFRQSMGIKDLADRFYISRRQLEIRFRAALNTSLRNYLIRFRLKEAKRLLLSSKATVEDIAAMTGFCHAPHLSHSFKKYFNCTPVQFRKAHRSV